jgi:outer membrane lipoprotein-sorting protein
MLSVLADPAESALFPVLEEHARVTKDLVAGMKWTNGQAFIDNAHSSANSLNDYTAETRLTGQMRDKLKDGNGKFFFKKNKRVRVEVTKGSVNNGAIVVKKEDGSVEARGGGMLKFMKMSLQPDSRMLELPNGNSVVSSDIPSLFASVKARLHKSTAKARLGSEHLTSNRWKGPVKVVEIVEGDFEQITDRIFLNPKTNLPVEWDVYKDGALISVTFFDNLKENVGLDDSLFDL